MTIIIVKITMIFKTLVIYLNLISCVFQLSSMMVVDFFIFE